MKIRAAAERAGRQKHHSGPEVDLTASHKSACAGTRLCWLWMFILWTLAAPQVLAQITAGGADEVTVRVITSSSVDFRDVTGGRVPNVRFEIGPYTGTTDANGYGFVKISLGSYRVKAHMPCPVSLVYTRGSMEKVGGADIEPELKFTDGTVHELEFHMYTADCNPAAGMTRVKIVTSQSCTDGPNEEISILGGVEVDIGDKTRVFTDDQGIAEIDLPPGTYPVSALWKDTAFGYVSQNGLRQKTLDAAFPHVTLSPARAILARMVLPRASQALGRSVPCRPDHLSFTALP